MLKRLTLLLTAAMLLLGLTACGCSAEDKSPTGTGNTTVSNGSPAEGETTAPNQDSAGSGAAGDSGSIPPVINDSAANTPDNGNTLLEDAQNAVDQGVNDVKDALDGTDANAPSAGGVSFRRMLKNGRVHDRDGDLTDGENSVSGRTVF